jgi:hypothetical protein
LEMLLDRRSGRHRTTDNKRSHVSPRRVHRRAHRVRRQVDLPSKNLHEEHTAEGVDGRFFEDLVVIREIGRRLGGQVIVCASARNEVLVTFNGHGGFVVGMVG